jgi:hypothetical protein
MMASQQTARPVIATTALSKRYRKVIALHDCIFSCLTARGLRSFISYQPASRY